MPSNRSEWGQLLFILFIFFGIGSTIWNWDAIQDNKKAKKEAAFNEKLLIGRLCPESDEFRYQVDSNCAHKMRNYLRKRK